MMMMDSYLVLGTLGQEGDLHLCLVQGERKLVVALLGRRQTRLQLRQLELHPAFLFMFMFVYSW